MNRNTFICYKQILTFLRWHLWLVVVVAWEASTAILRVNMGWSRIYQGWSRIKKGKVRTGTVTWKKCVLEFVVEVADHLQNFIGLWTSYCDVLLRVSKKKKLWNLFSLEKLYYKILDSSVTINVKNIDIYIDCSLPLSCLRRAEMNFEVSFRINNCSLL